jgi:pyruvate/2-oxoacid:ferredoxin oxidoreductase alpha subunit
MARQLIKGNEAVVKGAILAGCRAFYGYPITPATEIAECAARDLPKIGGVFLQAESEVAAINMVYGAAASGVRVMTASSGPGLSLMQEGLSYIAGAELPCVVVDIMRGGPGLGNIAPEQGDYNQIVKGGGHGSYRVFVLAPSSVQEMADHAMLGFEIADAYRNPVVILADGYIGQMMEAVELPARAMPAPRKSWAVEGNAATRANLISSIYLEPAALEAHVRRLEAKDARAATEISRAETWRVDDAEIVLVGYGVVARILRAAAETLQARGHRVGLFRPITLFPFPEAALRSAIASAARVLVVEMSTGQLVDDVRLAALGGGARVDLFGRVGGVVPTVAEIVDRVLALQEDARAPSSAGVIER